MTASSSVNGNNSPSGRIVASVLAGMAGAWIAADSIGLVADPLRHVLTWLALGLSIVLAWPGRKQIVLPGIAIVVMLALPMWLPTGATHGVMMVALVLATLAIGRDGIDRRVLLLTSVAVAVFGVYRLACVSIPTVWLVADYFGMLFGRLAGIISGRPLWVGAGFGGVDMLVLMSVLIVGWFLCTSPPRSSRVRYAIIGVLACQLAYLIVLSFSTALFDALPPPPIQPETMSYEPPNWSWSDAARAALPWNLPVLNVVFQLVVAGAMLRWTTWQPVTVEQDDGTSRNGAFEFWPTILAILVPIVVSLSLSTADLSNKKIVAYEQGYLDWAKPEHDAYGQESAGLYGMLSSFVQSLGGKFTISSELSDADLDDADLLVLLHPSQPWREGQLERIEQFVRRGGSLLLAAAPAVREDDNVSCFNDVLKPTAMFVRHDVAVPETESWQHACETLTHSSTLGLGDRAATFGVQLGSSIQAGWPARPILVGRWGWSDPGSDAMMTGVFGFDTGEKLGDLVLVAEQRLGLGRIVVLGDSSCLTNESLPWTYPFAGRMLGYLAGQSIGTQVWWRQLLGVSGCIGLVWLLVWHRTAGRIIVVSLLLSVSLAVCAVASHHAARVVPGDKIAYVDASHLEAYSSRAWSEDGINGLLLTLMRNGYLPFVTSDLTPDRLETARMLISIAPSRSFSADKRQMIGRFVKRGGLFVCMVGARDSLASRPLLEEFDLRVPHSPVQPNDDAIEPQPIGCVRVQFLNAKDYGGDDYYAKTIFRAGWPVDVSDSNLQVLVRGPDNQPVVVARQVDSGHVVLIGDSEFAMNKNLEFSDGSQLFEHYDNSHFWRWLISRFTTEKEWIPPKPPDEETPPQKSKDVSGKKVSK